MLKKERYRRVISYFESTMPDVSSELAYTTPFQLLVAVVLSAQCTDKRVNMVTPALFSAFPTAESMSESTEEEIFSYIKSVSYPNSKSKHLLGLSKMLVSEYGGEVPDTLESLTRLPGVGRKTANVIQAVLWNKAAFAVDTHIFRVSHRLGLVSDKATTPYAVEQELTKIFPDELIPRAHHWLLLHGRYVCQSRKAKCNECGLQDVCKSYGKL
ncbi:MAG: endonuclease III [Bacteroidaceae bacterium]|nr:endonuclease III [Bacteroidaceae bacterium]